MNAGAKRTIRVPAPQHIVNFIVADEVRSYNLMMETTEIFEFDKKYQAVRLPEGFTFEGKWVYLKRVGNAIVLLPYDKPWETLIESLSRFSDDFMSERNQY